MTHIGYLIAGWGISAVVVFLYSWTLIKRGKQIAQRIPEDRRRWISSDDATQIGES